MTENIALYKFTTSEEYNDLDSEVGFLDNEQIEFILKQLKIEIYILENMKI